MPKPKREPAPKPLVRSMPSADAAEVLRRLEIEFPGARTALDFTSPLELLVATVLSAQCTDKRVNEVTRELFKKYRSASDYAGADLATLASEIRPTGFYRQKAKSLVLVGKDLVERYGGDVPPQMEELVKLHGIGRKTANVVLGEAFGIQSGIAVDTHVKRLAGRLGFSARKDPEKIEVDLIELVARDRWSRFSQLLIHHGRRTCVAARPRCADCALNDICPSAFSFA